MGRKKKKFNKKNAVTLSLVNRSQFDPRSIGNAHSTNVFQEANPGQRKLPTDFPREVLQSHFVGEHVPYDLMDDEINMRRRPGDYDYSKHLKDIAGKCSFYSRFGEETKGLQSLLDQEPIHGEEEFFPEGDVGIKFNEVKPNKCLVPMSKDFRDALDSNSDGDFEEIQDDFISAAAVEGEDDEDTNISNPNPHRFNTLTHKYEEFLDFEAYEDYEDYEGDEGDEGEVEDMFEENNKPKTVLDEQFERALALYDDDEIGELDEDNPEVQGKIEDIMESYSTTIDNFSNTKQNVTDCMFGIQPDSDKIHLPKSSAEIIITTTSTTSTTSTITLTPLNPADKYTDEYNLIQPKDKEDRKDLIQSYADDVLRKEEKQDIKDIHRNIDAIYVPPIRDKWDCESIITTYSNMENHPTVIKAPRRSHFKEVKLSKDGIPLEGLMAMRESRHKNTLEPLIEEGEENEENEGDESDTPENEGRKRNKKETKEEKKRRKTELKALRKKNRRRKKLLKMKVNDEIYTNETRKIREAVANPICRRMD